MTSTNLLGNGIKVIIEEAGANYYNGLQIQILPDGRIRKGAFRWREIISIADCIL